jgi:hypothetical protein
MIAKSPDLFTEEVAFRAPAGENDADPHTNEISQVALDNSGRWSGFVVSDPGKFRWHRSIRDVARYAENVHLVCCRQTGYR